MDFQQFVRILFWMLAIGFCVYVIDVIRSPATSTALTKYAKFYNGTILVS